MNESHVGAVRVVKTDNGERYEGVLLASAILAGQVEHGTKLYIHATTDPRELSNLLRELLEYAELGWDFEPEIAVRVRAALKAKALGEKP
jgi:hypothetical protein